MNNFLFPFMDDSDRRLITFPRVSSDLLMLAPSWNNIMKKFIIFLTGRTLKKILSEEDSWKFRDNRALNLMIIALWVHLSSSDWSCYIPRLYCRSTYMRFDVIVAYLEYNSLVTLSRSPDVFACDCLSLPARSTRLILLVIECSCFSCSIVSTYTKNKLRRNYKLA